MSFSYVFIILGSIGMIIFATKFPFSTSIKDLRIKGEKFIGLNGCQVWIWSWILIIAGTFIQLTLYFLSLINPWIIREKIKMLDWVSGNIKHPKGVSMKEIKVCYRWKSCWRWNGSVSQWVLSGGAAAMVSVSGRIFVNFQIIFITKEETCRVTELRKNLNQNH